MRNEIVVIYSDAWREREIARIPMCYKNRARVNALLDSLNARYAGYGHFTTIECTHINAQCQDQRTLDRIRQNRIN